MYEHNKAPLKWKCLNGHVWEAPAVEIKNMKSWCPLCASNRKKSLSYVLTVARKMNGKLVSTKYINSKTPLLWECSMGHRF